jgi:hypothetical protein
MATLLSYALCAVSDVKELLDIDSGDSSKNNLITRKINQATEMIEGYTGRRFAAATYTEYYDGTLTDQLVLKQRPINSVTSLSARSTTLNDADWDVVPTNDYFIDTNAGILSAVSTFYGGWDRWQVIYNAGYSTIPSDLQEACATLSAYLTTTAADFSGGAIKRKTEGSRSIEYYNRTTGDNSIIAQLNLDEILDRYSDTIISGLV